MNNGKGKVIEIRVNIPVNLEQRTGKQVHKTGIGWMVEALNAKLAEHLSLIS